MDKVCEALTYHVNAVQLPCRPPPYLIQSARKALRGYDLNEVDRLLLLASEFLHEDASLVDQSKLDRMIMIWMEAMSDNAISPAPLKLDAGSCQNFARVGMS